MIKRLGTVLVVLIAFALGMILSRYAPLPRQAEDAQQATTTQAATAKATQTARPTLTPSSTLPPTALATFTPSPTLLPPPTLEPPTNTPPPSPLPSATPSFTPFALATVPGLIGGETATPITTPGCVVRKDWKLTYEVKPNDALINIAALYNTSADELVKGNCLADKNKIYVGEVLHVPGSVQPNVPPWTCIPIQNLTPVNGTTAIGSTGNMVFHWYGPRTPRNLIRVFAPDGTKIEYMVELRQDYTIDLTTIPKDGQYTWYVYPLDSNFQQPCPEGGPWTFSKTKFIPSPTVLSPVRTPTP